MGPRVKGRKRGTGGPWVRMAPKKKTVLFGRPWRNRKKLGEMSNVRGGARKNKGWEREAQSSGAWFLSSRVERKNLLGDLAERQINH